MPELAKRQVSMGASGITVAKVGEAEVMAGHGLQDIFIANEIVGSSKLERIRALNRNVKIRIGVDNEYQVDQIEEVFKDEPYALEVLIEVEVGENRSGVITDEQLIRLAGHIKNKKRVLLKGVFSHEGHSYKANDAEDCRRIATESQQRTLRAANIIKDMGIAVDTVSIGATPSLMHSDIMEGITEIRPGTYIFMDVGQGSAIDDFSRCAATILTSVISKPTDERIVLDAGAKALTAQTRSGGICSTSGYGLVKNSDNVRLSGVYDVIYSREYSNYIEIGDKIEVIPNHICPVCNLYESAYLVSNGERAAAYWRERGTDTTVSFKVNPPEPRIRLATAKRSNGAFVVDCISTDGGGIPRNVIVSMGLALVKLQALTLKEFVQKTSYNPSRILGLTNKGHFKLGADADISVLDLERQQAVMSLVNGNVIMYNGYVCGKGSQVITTAAGAAYIRDKGLTPIVVNLEQSGFYNPI